MHVDNLFSINSSQKVISVKAILLALFDIFGVSIAIISFINLDAIEKVLLFLLSVIFFGYRIYHLHLDSVNKRLTNDGKRLDNEERKQKIDSKQLKNK